MPKKWTNKECDICKTYILESVGNLQRAFRLTEETTGRPVISIAKSYYNKNSTLGNYLQRNNIYLIIEEDQY